MEILIAIFHLVLLFALIYFTMMAVACLATWNYRSVEDRKWFKFTTTVSLVILAYFITRITLSDNSMPTYKVWSDDLDTPVEECRTMSGDLVDWVVDDFVKDWSCFADHEAIDFLMRTDVKVFVEDEDEQVTEWIVRSDMEIEHYVYGPGVNP